MSLVRLVIAWLVLAALPLQGFAAASMLFCDAAAHPTVATTGAHDHAGHGHVPGMAEQSAGSGGQAAGPHGGGIADDGHGCPICASCCNLVAVSVTPILGLAGDSPAAPALHGPVRVSTRDAPTPDKPPRV